MKIKNIALFPNENNIVLSYEGWIKGKNLEKNNDKGEIVNKKNINKEDKNKNNQSQQKIINEAKQYNGGKENQDKEIETKN